MAKNKRHKPRRGVELLKPEEVAARLKAMSKDEKVVSACKLLEAMSEVFGDEQWPMATACGAWLAEFAIHNGLCLKCFLDGMTTHYKERSEFLGRPVVEDCETMPDVEFSRNLQ